MWRSRRKSSRDNDIIDGSIRRSSSNLNFSHRSFKDVENLFKEDDVNDLNKTLDQPLPCSTAARRLSIFHRVHLASQFARAFSTKQILNQNKSSPDSKNVVAAEKLGKSDRAISIPEAEKRIKCPPESNNVATADKLGKSDGVITIPEAEKRSKCPPESKNVSMAEKLGKSDGVITTPEAEKRYKSPPESNDVTTAEKLGKSDGVISIPGAEKRVVVYMTSLRVVRPTFEACRSVQSILRGFRVSIDERDLSMDCRFLDELQSIMSEGGEDEIEKSKLTLPRVFIGGRYIGGAEEVKQLHETGELKKFVEGLPPVTDGVCEGCGDFRFILCDECSGSHKCYTEKSGFRSCTLCNENGLIRCPNCLGR